MMRAVVFLASLISALAFAPVTKTVQSSALKMAFETELGAQPPLGFFDPLGLLKDGDVDKFNRLRFCELKHGRVAMLAVLGHIVQQNVRFPGYLDLEGLKFADLPNGLHGLASVPALGLAQIILSIGWWELKGWKQVEGSFPGDFGLPYPNWVKTEEQKLQKRAIELNNGRAAMMGIFALVVHELIDGRPYVINDILGLPYSF